MVFEHVDRKDAKCCGFSFDDFTYLKIPACQLKRMANEEDEFFVLVIWVFIPIVDKS
jgi:hypothetical protein